MGARGVGPTVQTFKAVVRLPRGLGWGVGRRRASAEGAENRAGADLEGGGWAVLPVSVSPCGLGPQPVLLEAGLEPG